jgi:hypothetical protein
MLMPWAIENLKWSVIQELFLLAQGLRRGSRFNTKNGLQRRGGLNVVYATFLDLVYTNDKLHPDDELMC